MGGDGCEWHLLSRRKLAIVSQPSELSVVVAAVAIATAVTAAAFASAAFTFATSAAATTTAASAAASVALGDESRGAANFGKVEGDVVEEEDE